MWSGFYRKGNSGWFIQGLDHFGKHVQTRPLVLNNVLYKKGTWKLTREKLLKNESSFVMPIEFLMNED